MGICRNASPGSVPRPLEFGACSRPAIEGGRRHVHRSIIMRYGYFMLMFGARRDVASQKRKRMKRDEGINSGKSSVAFSLACAALRLDTCST